MAILWNGVWVRGMGCRGPPGLPLGWVYWQVVQVEQYSLTSLYIPGQNTLARSLAVVAASPMCPPSGQSCASSKASLWRVLGRMSCSTSSFVWGSIPTPYKFPSLITNLTLLSVVLVPALALSQAPFREGSRCFSSPISLLDSPAVPSIHSPPLFILSPPPRSKASLPPISRRRGGWGRSPFSSGSSFSSPPGKPLLWDRTACPHARI